ncbi:MAG: lipoate--protein ligase [Pseudomonadota bacterium]
MQPLDTCCHEEQRWNERRLAQTVHVPALRLWSYRAPGVVLGCSQRAHYERLSRGDAGIDIVARQAGGGAVLTGPWMLSASIVLPHGHPLASPNLVHSYRWLGELYAAVLRRRGIAAHAINPAEAARLQAGTQAPDWACYGGYSPWEVVVGQRKIVGLAQVRRRTGVLLVAGLLLEQPDWSLLSRAMGQPPADADALFSCTTSCAQQRGPGDWLDEIAGPLRRALDYALFELEAPALCPETLAIY